MTRVVEVPEGPARAGGMDGAADPRPAVMIVDDCAATRRLVRLALEREGHAVVEAADGRAARALMRTLPPRVVLQDMMLPDVDGFALAMELRALAAGMPVAILAFSGFVSELDGARVTAAGFDDIIPKPIAPGRMIAIVAAHLPATAAAAVLPGTGRRVVIADDDPLQLKLATFRLTHLGYDTVPVVDGHAALAEVRRHPPDLLISDVMMPGLDGFGLAMAVRQDPALSRVPVLLVTSSYVEDADRELARRAGATDLLPRTPELTELLEAVHATLALQAELPPLPPGELDGLEREHGRRVVRQLERQVMLNTGLARRCSALASELAVLTGMSQAVLQRRDVSVALDDALVECLDAVGITAGALYVASHAPARPTSTFAMRPLGADHGDTPVRDLATLFGHVEVLHGVLAAGTPLHLPGSTLAPDVERELLERATARALLVVPLPSPDGPLGALLMIARGRRLDPLDWATFARGVATQVGHVLTVAAAYDARAAAEQRAVEHAALLDALLASAPDRVVHIDLAGQIRFDNRDPAAVGTSLLAEPSGDHQGKLVAALARLRATGTAQGFEAEAVQPGGAKAWLSTRLGPVREGDRLVGVVVVARDVSDKRQAELQLMVADRMASVGTLAAGVAHEINNPLASVIANLDLAMQDLAEVPEAHQPAELREELQDARTGAERVREIVRDLKMFSRAEEDLRDAVDVQLVLESTLRMAWNELRHRARVVKRYERVPAVIGNESRLGQVFLNLIVNAAQAIPAGNAEAHRVTVSTSLDASGHVVVLIGDTGEGIPQDVQPRLFTPFFSTKPVGVGTGLGLAISHRIVEQLGGTITFKTEVGTGTEFRVTLPPATTDATPRAVTRAPVEPPPMRRASVLIIDDEEALAFAIRRSLAKEHEVTAVFNGRTALDLIIGGARYDVILCDLMMPQVTGMELHAHVLALDPAQARRMVFLTGGAFTLAARTFLDATPNARVEKPFQLSELKRLVNALVAVP